MFFLDVGVVVNWEQTQYSTTEGSVLSVCAVQLEPTEKGFGVVIIRTLSTEGVLTPSKAKSNLLLLYF